MSKIKFFTGVVIGAALGVCIKTALDNREAFTAAVLDRVQDVRDDFTDFKEFVTERMEEAAQAMEDGEVVCDCSCDDIDDDELTEAVDEIIEKLDDTDEPDEAN